MKEKIKREKWIDSVKGIAIILVVVGHVIGGYTGDNFFYSINNFLKYFMWTIYTFHMPLFFMISGVVYEKYEVISCNNDYLRIAKKKSLNLLIPYFIFSTLQIIVKLPLQGKIDSQVSVSNIWLLPIKPIDQFWFIYSLFFIFLIIGLVRLFKLNPKVVIITLFIGTLFFKTTITDNVLLSNLKSIIVGSFYFYIGVLLQKRNNHISKRYSSIVYLFIFMITNILYNNLALMSELKSLFLVVMAMCGSLFVISLCKANNRAGEVNILQIVGKHSFEIYIIHVLLCAVIRRVLIIIGIKSVIIHFVLGIGLSIIIPIIISKFMSRFKCIDFIFKPTKYLNIDKINKDSK